MSIDYKKTVILPATDFPMRAGLPKLEPKLLAKWQSEDLYAQIRRQSKGREKFVLHDGPPYANGHLHIGHALNKILKDVINRAQQMLGKDAEYVPGWDCHGLPIEWKIEEKYRAKKKNKDDVPIKEFREECRQFAAEWIDIQREEFKRLGVFGDWDTPYTTMTFAAEAQIAREIGKFLMDGTLYQGSKPVMWSVVERTALAEAEVEYREVTSKTVHVRFPVISSPLAALKQASVIIWTTTPWTLPANRAVVYGAAIRYQVIKVRATEPDAWAKTGEHIVVCAERADEVTAAARITRYDVVAEFTGAEAEDTVLAHPLRGRDYDFDVPLLPAGYVTTDTGTGFVHTAPGHGQDDYETGLKHGLEQTRIVGPDGAYYDDVPLFAGQRVLYDDGKEGKANEAVIAALLEAGGLLARGRLTHSYPHSWRSKKPVIFRNTPQWFISMDKRGLRDTALKAIDATRFVPDTGRTRLRAMIETRPDWCVSRQRAWGVPIPVFVHKISREPLRDQKVLDRICAAFAGEGADAWFNADPARFLKPEYKVEDYEQVTDILDVWFDSGATHSYVLEGRNTLSSPADLYLEGSDQHRGWFHSSLLESCGTRGRAPYKAVLTHGFVLDGDGRKMSKSLGNVVTPRQVVDKYGADILRLWVVSSDYHDDLRISDEIIKGHTDIYRRLRNTLRFLLGNLSDYDADKAVAYDALPEPERWVLNRLTELDALARAAADAYAFHKLFVELHNFCAGDLSAFFLDIRKDALYCDRPDSPRRHAAQTVMDEVFRRLVCWLAPVLCFTAEEAWGHRYPDGGSVHAEVLPDTPTHWKNPALATKWEVIRKLRRAVTGAIEIERKEKRIGGSLEAAPVVYASAEDLAALDELDLAEICITSAITLVAGEGPETAFRTEDAPGVAVVPDKAAGGKCERCWQILECVGVTAAHPGLCTRCAAVIEAL